MFLETMQIMFSYFASYSVVCVCVHKCCSTHNHTTSSGVARRSLFKQHVGQLESVTASASVSATASLSASVSVSAPAAADVSVRTYHPD